MISIIFSPAHRFGIVAYIVSLIIFSVINGIGNVLILALLLLIVYKKYSISLSSNGVPPLIVSDISPLHSVSS